MHGYPFFALFFAFSVDLCLGGIGAFFIRIENISLRNTYVFCLLRFKFHCSVQPQGICNLQQGPSDICLIRHLKKNRTLFTYTRYVYGYPFFALFFAFSVDLCWGGIGAFLLRIENISLRKTYVFRFLRFKFHCSVQPQGICNLQQGPSDIFFIRHF